MNKEGTNTVIRSSRDNNFNIIRFVAAVMVVYGHMYHLLVIPENYFLNQAISTIGVKIFFLISGYLIACSYMRDRNIIRYSIRRSFRILPGLVGVVVISAVIVGPFFSVLSMGKYFAHPQFWSYFKNIVLNIQFFLPGVFVNNPYPNAVNGSLWSLPVEVIMYIAVPVLFLMFRKVDKIKIAVVFSILLEAIFLGLKLFNPSISIVVYNIDLMQAIAIMPYFLVGIIFSSKEVKKYLNLQLATGLLVIATMLNVSDMKSEVMVFVLLPYFIFSFAFAEQPLFIKCFAKNDYSYGMYLYGFLVQQIVIQFILPLNFSMHVSFVISTVVTFVLAMFSWHCIEKPFQNIGKRILQKDKIKKLPQCEMKVVE